MRKTPKRSDADIARDRKIGAALAFVRNRDALQTQTVFSKRLGVSVSRLANIESGRTSLPALIGWNACKILKLHPTWLCEAGNFGEAAFPKMAPSVSEAIDLCFQTLASAPFHQAWPTVRWLLSQSISKDFPPGTEIIVKTQPEVDIKISPDITSGVQIIHTYGQLLSRLREITKPRGVKSQIARKFNVSRQAVDKWLSGESKPSAEIAIELQHWKPEQPKK